MSTPRTDAAEVDLSDVVWTEFAGGRRIVVTKYVPAYKMREMERELSRVTADLADCRENGVRLLEAADGWKLVAEEAKRDEEGIRELMNVYNVGGWTDALGPMKRALEAEKRAEAAEADAARYLWLTADHDDHATREQCRAILERMPVMSYSAATAAIDAALANLKG